MPPKKKAEKRKQGAQNESKEEPESKGKKSKKILGNAIVPSGADGIGRIVINNKSTPGLQDSTGATLSDENLDLMVQACNLLLPTFCAEWAVACPTVVIDNNVDPGNDWEFVMIDTYDAAPGAAAFHTEEQNGNVDGSILVKTILDGGGFILMDPKLPQQEGTIRGYQGSTIASALFHEICEALIDSTVNCLWSALRPVTILHDQKSSTNAPPTFPRQRLTIVDGEVCDPVQQNLVVVAVGDQYVGLSDFILPSWKDNGGKAPFNYGKSLPNPFTIDLGGYCALLQSNGQETQVFSKMMPDWVKAWKQKSYRKRKLRRNLEEPPAAAAAK